MGDEYSPLRRSGGQRNRPNIRSRVQHGQSWSDGHAELDGDHGLYFAVIMSEHTGPGRETTLLTKLFKRLGDRMVVGAHHP